MFYILSKVLTIFLSPLVWFLILFITGLILKNKKKIRKILIISSIIVIYIFSNSFILNSAVKLWEIKPTEYSIITKTYDYGIVLGGLASFEEDYEMANFHEAADRLLYAVKLYHENKIDKILISGGSAKLLNQEIKEADFLKEFLIEIKIPEEDIIIENKSRNTFENAKFTAQILENSCDTSSFLMFTSALHMKRALACFKKQNIFTDSFSVDYESNTSEMNFNYLLVPKLYVADGWSLFLHEVLGYYIYKFRNYL